MMSANGEPDPMRAWSQPPGHPVWPGAAVFAWQEKEREVITPNLK